MKNPCRSKSRFLAILAAAAVLLGAVWCPSHLYARADTLVIDEGRYRWADTHENGAAPPRAGDDGSSWHRYRFARGPEGRRGRRTLWVGVTVPAKGGESAALLVTGMHQEFEAYIDGRRIYRFGLPGAPEPTRFPGYRWHHLIGLPAGTAAATVYFKVTSNYQAIGPGRIVAGPRDRLITYMLGEDMGKLLTGFLFIAIGLTVVFMFTIRSNRVALAERRDLTAFSSFAAFTTLLGLSLVADTATKELFLDAPRFWIYLRLSSLYLFLSFLSLFLLMAVPVRLRRAITALTVLYFIYPLTVIPLSLAGLIPLMHTILPFNVMLLAGLLFFLGNIVAWSLRHDPNARIFLVGFTPFMIAGLRDALVDMGILDRTPFIHHWGALIFIIALAVITARRFTAIYRRYAGFRHELTLAEQIIRSLLPPGAPAIPGLRIATGYAPKETVGGDLYDFHVSPGGLGVMVCDVAGHGISSSLVASMVKVIFTLARDGEGSAGTLMARMNRMFTDTMTDTFVTATYAIIDPLTRRLTVANAGHPSLIIWRREAQELHELRPRGRLLGFDPEAAYETAEGELVPGDRIIFYTDGITEALDEHGRYFGERQFGVFIREHQALTPDDFIDRLLHDLRRWHAAPADADDRTIVVIDVI